MWTALPHADVRPASPVRARPRGVRATLWAWSLGLCLALSAVYPFVPQAVQMTSYRIVGIFAVVGLLVGIRLNRLRPLPWVLIALGQLSFVLGDALWDVYDLILHLAPTPSPADVLYVAGYPFIAAGLAVLSRRRAARADNSSLIDATIITVGAGVVAWVFLLSPFAARRDADRPGAPERALLSARRPAAAVDGGAAVPAARCLLARPPAVRVRPRRRAASPTSPTSPSPRPRAA